MSPEQIQSANVDQRSDIFSVGVVLYDMITGQLPFKGDYEAAVSYAILHEEPEPLERYKAGISDELQRIVDKGLAKSLNERYQHVDEMLVDLRAITKGLETGHVKAGAIKARLPKRKRRFLYVSMATLLIFFILGSFYFFVGRTETIESIAVLPFENLSGAPEQEYFADGMTEALIANLTQIRALKVISRTSVMQYKDLRKPLPEIARELNVDVILEGTVLHVGNQVRVTAQLIEASTDQHLWAKSYQRDLQDILVLQSELAQAIVEEIEIAVTPEEEARLARSKVVNTPAYKTYLKGRYFWNKRTKEGFEKAIKYFEKAIEKDPTYPLSFVGLADTYSLLGEYAYLSPKDAFPKAKAAVLKALEIEETVAEAHASLGQIRFAGDWDWPGAEQSFQRAIELNPGYATAHHWYAFLLTMMGRHDEALTEIRKAQELDPLSLVINTNIGYIYYFARRYDEAIDQYREVVELDPDFVNVYYKMRQVYAQKGDFKQALAAEQRRLTINGWEWSAQIGLVYASSGARDQALEILQKMKGETKQSYMPPYLFESFAKIYLGLGENEKALVWLERAYDERATFLRFLAVDPDFDTLRPDPRFQELLQRMKFP